MKTPTKDQVVVYIYIAGAVVAVYFVYRIMVKLGLVDTFQSKQLDKEKELALNQMRKGDYWRPEYYKTQRFTPLGAELAKEYANDLRKAVRGIGTDEEVIYTTFGKLNSKAQISEIAEQYRDSYIWWFTGGGDNLQADILDDLKEKEVLTLMDIINKI
jgi:hypothetical protein